LKVVAFNYQQCAYSVKIQDTAPQARLAHAAVSG